MYRVHEPSGRDAPQRRAMITTIPPVCADRRYCLRRANSAAAPHSGHACSCPPPPRHSKPYNHRTCRVTSVASEPTPTKQLGLSRRVESFSRLVKGAQDIAQRRVRCKICADRNSGDQRKQPNIKKKWCAGHRRTPFATLASLHVSLMPM
jgi:hypothetical protein